MASLNNDFTVVKGKGLHSFSIKTALNTTQEKKAPDNTISAKNKKA